MLRKARKGEKDIYDYGFQFEDQFASKEIDPKKEVKVNPKDKQAKSKTDASLELKIEHVLVQFTNDLYEMVYQEQNFDMGKIERLLMINLEQKFNRSHTARLMGLSVRTVRNKMNGTGH